MINLFKIFSNTSKELVISIFIHQTGEFTSISESQLKHPGLLLRAGVDESGPRVQQVVALHDGASDGTEYVTGGLHTLHRPALPAPPHLVTLRGQLGEHDVTEGVRRMLGDSDCS